MRLEEFNELDRAAAVAALIPCIDVQRWAGEIADARPFASRTDLLAAAERAALPFTAAEVEGALAHHPRIGERASGDSREATMSRAEQSGVSANDAGVTDALAAGNAAYEERFGRVFLIAAAGKSGPEILAALHARLDNDPADEDLIVAEQLRRIALLRLEGLVTP